MLNHIVITSDQIRLLVHDALKCFDQPVISKSQARQEVAYA
ncbi:hypothetical protein [Candidatus Comchoanobacter bicostacola]|nr:hypothetical protein [Candidatus Comchoanobacter bicostacola]